MTRTARIVYEDPEDQEAIRKELPGIQFGERGVALFPAEWWTPKVEERLRGIVNLVLYYVDFEREELDSAESLLIEPGRQTGYPQPEVGDWDARLWTTRCGTCGVHGEQKNDLCVNKLLTPPGKMWSVTWVPDAIVAHNDVWDKALSYIGAHPRPVTIGSRKLEVSDICKQVSIDVNWRVLGTEGLQDEEVCKECGTRRWFFDNSSYFPRVERIGDAEIGFTEQWFGSGGESYRQLVATQKGYQTLKKAVPKNLIGFPCLSW